MIHAIKAITTYIYLKTLLYVFPVADESLIKILLSRTFFFIYVSPQQHIIKHKFLSDQKFLVNDLFCEFWPVIWPRGHFLKIMLILVVISLFLKICPKLVY